MAQLQIGSKSAITCQNSEMAHFFRPQTLRWLKIEEAVNISNQDFVRILSYLRVFGLKKWAISEFWLVVVDFEPIWSWAISKSHAYASTWQHLLRWLFEPSQGPPRIFEWYWQHRKIKMGILILFWISFPGFGNMGWDIFKLIYYKLYYITYNI